MCLLDAVVQWDANHIECCATSHRLAHNPLRAGDALPVHAGIEYAGQAIAAHGSLLARQHSGVVSTPRQGMIAILNGIRWHTARLDDISGPITVHATRLTVLPQGLEYDFRVQAEGRTLIEGNMIVALQGEAA